MLFWVLCIAFAALALLPVLRVMSLGREIDSEPADLAIYRDQLTEVARDRDRGLIDADEAERAELEIQRRLLDAAARGAAPTGRAPRMLTWIASTAVALGVLAGGLGLYTVLGAPGYQDMPLALRMEMAAQARAARMSQAEAETRAAGMLPEPRARAEDFVALLERLRAALENRPEDIEGFRLLARNEASAGNFVAARRAQERVVDLLGDDADANDHATLAETMILAAAGFVSPQAETELDAALAVDPSAGLPRYFKGLAAAQIGRPDLAFGLWRALLSEGPADAPWIAPIEAQIEEVAALAGIRYDGPPPQSAPGPSAAQTEEAAEMDPDARREMIQGMVAGLAERLATEGGPAPDWARLITAYGVLGRADTARRIYVEAQDVFAQSPDDLALLRAAAERAGIAG